MNGYGQQQRQALVDRDTWHKVLENLISAILIALVFYILVAVFGFKFPKGHQVSPASAIG